MSSNKVPSTPTVPAVAPLVSKIAGIVKLQLVRMVQFDLDVNAFVVITFGTNTFRSRVTRQGKRGRDWNENVAFVVKESERSNMIKMSMYATFFGFQVFPYFFFFFFTFFPPRYQRGKFKSDNAHIAYCYVRIEDLLNLSNDKDKGVEAHLQLVSPVAPRHSNTSPRNRMCQDTIGKTHREGPERILWCRHAHTITTRCTGCFGPRSPASTPTRLLGQNPHGSRSSSCLR